MRIVASFVILLSAPAFALAQDSAPTPLSTDSARAPDTMATAPIEATVAAEDVTEPEKTPEQLQEEADNSADSLNSMQQLQQSFTLQRTVNGEVETEKRTVTYSRNEPVRQSEAGETTVERLRASFDSEVLTRIEAFEEAKLDFVLADVDRNGALTEQEFVDLVNTWRDNDARNADPVSPEAKKASEVQAFLDDIDPESARDIADANARRKFKFMAGAATELKQKDYISEYLLDFDSMDKNGDALLKKDELAKFRVSIRGETIEM